MLIFENVIYLIVYLFQLVVPDVSSRVQEFIDQHRYMEQHRGASPSECPSDVQKMMENFTKKVRSIISERKIYRRSEPNRSSSKVSIIKQDRRLIIGDYSLLFLCSI